MKWLKWTLLGILALVLVLIIALVIFAATFDANAYKDTITQKVQEVTGRELDLPGNIEVSIFPWLGLSLGEAALSNAKGFGEAPFAKVESVEVHVGLLSLFKRELIIKRVQLNGLELNLARNKAGVSNWDDLMQPAEAPPPGAEAPPPGEPGAEEPPAVAMLSELHLGGVQISRARVHWSDAAAGTELSIDPFNLTLDAFSFGRPTALSTDLRLLMKNPDRVLSINATTQVMLDIKAARYALQDLDVTLKAQGESIPGGSQTLKLKADLNADLGANQASLKPLKLSLANIDLEAGFDVANLDTTPQINGRLATKNFSVRELMKALGMEVPQTADAGVLNKAALSMDLSATPQTAELKNIAFTLDESNLSGTLGVSNFEAPAIRFDLALDAMNADRYLPPKEEAKPAAEAAPAPAGDDRIELPMEALRTLDLKGDMRIGHLVLNALEFKDVKLKVNADKGLIKLAPVSVQLYEGKAGSAITLDVRKSTPVYGFNFDLDGVQVGPILDILAGDKYLTGKSKMSASLSTRGDTVSGLKRALNGKLGFNLTDGAFTQSEIGESLVKAYTVMHSLQGKQVNKEKITRYNNMVGTANVKNGVMSNQDLKGDMPFFLVKGAGVVDLTRDHIDGYELGLAKYGDPSREHVYFPIAIKGPLDDPSVKLDFNAYQKALLKGKVEKEKAEAKERIEKEVQEEVEEKLKDKFKGLFR